MILTNPAVQNFRLPIPGLTSATFICILRESKDSITKSNIYKYNALFASWDQKSNIFVRYSTIIITSVNIRELFAQVRIKKKQHILCLSDRVRSRKSSSIYHYRSPASARPSVPSNRETNTGDLDVAQPRHFNAIGQYLHGYHWHKAGVHPGISIVNNICTSHMTRWSLLSRIPCR